MLDLAALEFTTNVAGTQDVAIWVYAGRGTGEFVALEPEFHRADGFQSIVGEFDGLPGADVAVVGFSWVGTFLNRGDATFDGPVWSNNGAEVVSGRAVAFDADNDGIDDLLVEPEVSTDELVVLANDGAGAFLGTGMTVPTVAGCSYSAAARLPPFSDYAGGLVFAAGECSGPEPERHPLSLIWIQEQGGVMVSGLGPLAGPEPTEIAVGDFNGDGHPDFFVWNRGPQTLTYCEGSFVGHYSLAKEIEPAALCESCMTQGFDERILLGAARFDASDESDLVVGFGGELVVGLDPLSESAAWFPQRVPALSRTLGDFNGDGLADIAVETGQADTILLLLSDP